MKESEYQFSAAKLDPEQRAAFDRIRAARAAKIQAHGERKAKVQPPKPKPETKELL